MVLDPGLAMATSARARARTPRARAACARAACARAGASGEARQGLGAGLAARRRRRVLRARGRALRPAMLLEGGAVARLVHEQQQLLRLEAVVRGQELVRLDRAGLAPPAGHIEDAGDRPGQRAPVVLAVDEHLVVLAQPEALR